MSEIHTSNPNAHLRSGNPHAQLRSGNPHAHSHSGPERLAEPWASLQHQSRAHPIGDDEMEFARALEAIYVSGIVNFADVARQLSERGVVAPASRQTTWTVDLIEQELATINALLDDAYARNGIGA